MKSKMDGEGERRVWWVGAEREWRDKGGRECGGGRRRQFFFPIFFLIFNFHVDPLMTSDIQLLSTWAPRRQLMGNFNSQTNGCMRLSQN